MQMDQTKTHLVKFHELPDTVEHVVIFGRGTRHLLDNGRHVTKDSGIK